MDILNEFQNVIKQYDGTYFMNCGVLNQISDGKIYNIFVLLNLPNDKSKINITCYNNIEKLNKGIFVRDYIWAKECLEYGADNDVIDLIKDIKTNQVEIQIKLKSLTKEE